LGPSAMIGAIVGTGSLYLAGDADWGNFIAIGATWWLRDAAGALVVTPVVVLWAIEDFRGFNLDKVLASGATIVAASAVGLIAFRPVVGEGGDGGGLVFRAALPRVWSAVGGGGGDPATAMFILSGFAALCTLAVGGPFAGATLDDAFLLLIAFMLSISV